MWVGEGVMSVEKKREGMKEAVYFFFYRPLYWINSVAARRSPDVPGSTLSLDSSKRPYRLYDPGSQFYVTCPAPSTPRYWRAQL